MEGVLTIKAKAMTQVRKPSDYIKVVR